MIKSSVIAKSGIQELLQDPDAILKQIKSLQAAEKSSKKALKDLIGTKSVRKAQQEAKESLDEVTKEKQKVEQETSALKSEAEKEIQAREKACEEKERAAKESILDARAAASEAKKSKAEYNKLLKEAQQLRTAAAEEKARYLALQVEFTAKLDDLRARFAGLDK